MSPGRRAVIAVAGLIGAVVALNFVAQALDRTAGGAEPSGSPGSSFATADNGIAAYATLLSHYGYSVSRQRGKLGESDPVPANATIVLVDPSSFDPDDAATLLDDIAGGARLVTASRRPFYVNNLRDNAPQWRAAGPATWTQFDDPSFSGLRAVATAGQGSWRDPGSSRVAVGISDESLVTIDNVGRGQIFFLADPSPLTNQYLAVDDDAAFALALAGPPSRPVVFLEGPHGYGRSSGWSALPDRWKIALAIAALAALLFAWSRARRFGPPDVASRPLPPPRGDFVRALGTTLERTRNRPGTFAPLQAEVRDLVARRQSLPPDASPDDIARAARSLGCTEREVSAMLQPAMTDDDAIEIGNAIARINDNDRSIG